MIRAPRQARLKKIRGNENHSQGTLLSTKEEERKAEKSERKRTTKSSVQINYLNYIKVHYNE